MYTQMLNSFRIFCRRVCCPGTFGLLALLVSGCQATLFGVVNATSGSQDVEVHQGIVFDTEHHLALDVYAPPAAIDAPMIVFFYGGAWDSGRREWYRWLGEVLAQHGVVVAIPDYRKYPDVRLAGFLHDAARATAWASHNARRFGASPDKLFVMGHSAGAHLAALLATDDRWLQTVGMRPRDLAGFIGLAGPYDFLPLTDPKFIAMFGDEPAEQRRSQPIAFVNGDEPPMLLMYGTDDHTVLPRNSLALARAMRAAGEPVELIAYPDIGHARLLLSLTGFLPGNPPTLRDTLQFIQQHASGPVMDDSR